MSQGRVVPLTSEASQFCRHLWELTPERWWWASEGEPVDFVAAIRRESLDQALIVADDSTMVGIAVVYRPRWVHLTAAIAVYLDPSSHGTGWPLLRVRDYIDRIFDRYPFRKLVFDCLVDDPVVPPGTPLHIEGTLRQHVRIRGRFADVNVGAIFAEEWSDFRVPSPRGPLVESLLAIAGLTLDPALLHEPIARLEGVDSLTLAVLADVAESMTGREVSLTEGTTLADLVRELDEPTLG
jgi:RimJ/RimL family protein N-acetyltransferase